jgi:hypothetical protein
LELGVLHSSYNLSTLSQETWQFKASLCYMCRPCLHPPHLFPPLPSDFSTERIRIKSKSKEAFKFLVFDDFHKSFSIQSCVLMCMRTHKCCLKHAMAGFSKSFLRKWSRQWIWQESWEEIQALM